jgi:hypothetical protein
MFYMVFTCAPYAGYLADLQYKHQKEKTMIKNPSMLKKVALAVLLLSIGLAALPAFSASAAGLNDESNPPAGVPVSNERLGQAWARLQKVYARQGERLGRADAFIARLEGLIEKANAKGWDTSAVQAALDAFAGAIPAAALAHEPGAAIIASHAGFDESGKVTDRATAVETTRSLRQVIYNTRSAMNGSGEALREAIRAFREEHGLFPAETPVP